MRVLLILAITFIIIGCDNASKISQLEKEIESSKQTITRQETEIANKNEDIKKHIAQAEQSQKELDTVTKKNETASREFHELENKVNNLMEELGKEGLILPTFLIGRPIVIYTKPYEDVQIYIGNIQQIQHNEKVILGLPQGGQNIEIPFNNIIGYRLLK